MKDRARNALRRIQKLTEAKCHLCPTKAVHRCCDAMFCDSVQRGLEAIAVTIPTTGHASLRFMGPNGCVVPAELRPGCSGFVCREHLESDRGFRREWLRLHEKYDADPEVLQLMNAAVVTMPTKADLSGALLTSYLDQRPLA